MILLRKTIQTVTVLLLLLIGTALVLPSEMDLEFCIGNDGHIDFLLDDCKDAPFPKKPTGEGLPGSGTEHHDECTDISLACGIAQEFIPANYKLDSYGFTLKHNQLKAPFSFSGIVAGSTGAYQNSNPYPFFHEDFSSSHLISLRTTILLI